MRITKRQLRGLIREVTEHDDKFERLFKAKNYEQAISLADSVGIPLSDLPWGPHLQGWIFTLWHERMSTAGGANPDRLLKVVQDEILDRVGMSFEEYERISGEALTSAEEKVRTSIEDSKFREGMMKITRSQLRRVIREQLEEEQERSELDKIKEVFATGGAQAIELADMVGLGDDPVVYEMKEAVKVVIEILDVITDESFSGLGAGEHDMASQVWFPLVKKSLKKIYHPVNRWNDQFQEVHADMKKLMRVYWGWYHPRLAEAIPIIENLADWAGHPVELPTERRA